MDVAKQIAYWREGAKRDLAVVRSLLEKKHPEHALFFAHLALEKALKAHVSRETKSVPPYTHNLLSLVEIAKLHLRPEELARLPDFNAYQIQGRYPDSEAVPISLQSARKEFVWAEKMVNQLIKRL